MASRKKKKRTCFSKKLLIADYAILLGLIIAFFVAMNGSLDTNSLAIVIGAWIAQLAISSGFYYWKAKSENLLKMPIELLEDLPKDMREKADPNQIIASVIGMKDTAH